MTMTDDTVIDEEETTDPAAPGPNTSNATAKIRAWRDRWMGWPTWAKAVSVIVAGWVVLTVFTSITVESEPAPQRSPLATEQPSATTEPATTTTTVDPLKGLPALNPMVAALVHPADRSELVNLVRVHTIDGTPICSVFFGLTVEDGNTKWEITTPAMQAKSPDGVRLPASRWPLQIFTGAQCAIKDTPLNAAQATPATSPVGGGA